MLSNKQLTELMNILPQYMKPDAYDKYSISSVYYDTEDYQLIRHSIEKPLYKEKLRIRSYGRVSQQEHVFVELKKKFDGVVYKRRVVLPYSEALSLIENQRSPQGQIEREIQVFATRYALSPAVFIGYRRTAFQGLVDSSLRLTLDHNLQFRDRAIGLDTSGAGIQLLDTDLTLMEIKAQTGIPLWLARALSELELYPTSFSKYGTYYREFACRSRTGGFLSA